MRLVTLRLLEDTAGARKTRKKLYAKKKKSGGNVGGATPVPIPNTEVKPSGADGTAWETVWESR